MKAEPASRLLKSPISFDAIRDDSATRQKVLQKRNLIDGCLSNVAVIFGPKEFHLMMKGFKETIL